MTFWKEANNISKLKAWKDFTSLFEIVGFKSEDWKKKKLKKNDGDDDDDDDDDDDKKKKNNNNNNAPFENNLCAYSKLRGYLY